MKTTKSTNRAQSAVKKFIAIAATSAIAAVPMFAAISTSEAKPPRHAPAHGYRNKGKDDKHRDDYRRDNDRRDYDRRDDDDDDRRRNDYRRRDNDRRNDSYRRNDYRTLTGTVTGIRNNNVFDLRADGRTYNVYVSSRLPRGLDRNDVVRVYGVRSGTNDIRNASVSIIRNR